ncbi:MAG: TetR/AcrR family transcriptional regulator [Mycobacterium sp.]|nr:TetR/AcrR family transcriptional regulator [Mycobacterium sp.]
MAHTGRAPRQGPGRPAGVDSLDTRQRVIDAACQCFARYGYGPSTNNLIAETAGVTAGSVYYHFRTKRDLFGSVCEDVYGKLANWLGELEPADLSVAGLLRLVLRAALRINEASPDVAAFVGAAPVDARRHSELTEMYEAQAVRLDEAMKGFVVQGQRTGTIPPDVVAAEVSRLVRAVVYGFALIGAGGHPDELNRVADLFESQVLDVGSGSALAP